MIRAFMKIMEFIVIISKSPQMEEMKFCGVMKMNGLKF